MTLAPLVARARAWCRVDFAGGTLDIWPLGLLHPGAVTVNVAVDCPVCVELRRSARGEYSVEQGGSRIAVQRSQELEERPETALIGLVARTFGMAPFECTVSSGSPRGGGLGASSALTVALLRAAELLSGQKRGSDSSIMAMARDLEAQLMQLPTGTQDHAAALLGGVVELSYPPGGPHLRQLGGVDLPSLGDSLVLVYSGQSHFSAANNWQVVRRRLDGDGETRHAFDGLAETARQVVEALVENQLADCGRLMSEEWSFRRRLAEGISTPAVEKLLDVARSEGAWGGKACGAGGGGCVAVLCPPDKKALLESVYDRLGYRVIRARPTSAPLELGRGSD